MHGGDEFFFRKHRQFGRAIKAEKETPIIRESFG